MSFNKLKHRLLPRIIQMIQFVRIVKYKFLSNGTVFGKPRLLQPAQFVGEGEIHFEGLVTLGVFPSPFFFNGYAYIEARKPGSKITIGDGTWINNNFFAVSEYKSISIGRNVFIGSHVEIYDSNFHGLEPDSRTISSPEDGADVVVEDNVFIGSNVKILSGVTIGRDSVIANSAVVTRDISSGVIAGGNPAKILRPI